MKKILFFLLSLSFITFACVDQEFDEPEIKVSTVDFKSNTTIAELKKLHQAGQIITITDDKIIEATIIADDESGNYYKTLVIQDGTAGIELKINAAGLYNDFRIGSKVFVKCKDLVIGDYNGLIQLGGGTYDNNGTPALAGIEQSLVSSYVFKGGAGATIAPRVVKISELTPDMMSTLIQIENAEFAAGQFGNGLSYADGAKKLTLNRTIATCDKGTIVLRTSGYATFASEPTPSGNGSAVGVYSLFGTTKQLYIRTPSDIKFTNNRCDGTSGGGGGTVTGEPIAIGEIRNSYTGTKTTIAANKVISGVVISDIKSSNWNNQNCIIQGADGKGIMVRFSAVHNFALGEAVDVLVGGLDLSEFNSTLQINGVSLGNAKSQGKGTLPTPKKLTIAELLANFENYESTLVTIDNCAHPATKYAGSVLLDDKTGKLTLFTSNFATFANEAPISNVINVTGVIGQFNTTNQILIRSTADVTKGQGGSGGTGGGTATVVSIGSIRDEFKGTATTVSADKAIKGIVISDVENKNGSTLNCVIQGADGKGIMIRFGGAHTFKTGEEIEVNVSGQELSEFNSLLQINKCPLANAKVISTGNIAKVTTVTLAELIANFENYESTLVQVNNATVSGGKLYDANRGTSNPTKGTVKVTDGTATADIYTTVGATFGDITPPASPIKVTGVASEFTTAGAPAKGVQIILRNGNDLQ
jgi:Family of unknown function (DUF5689)